MLLVFGGTTEGKRVAHALSDAGLRFVYSTKLPVVMPPLPGMRLRFGPFDVPGLVAFCRAERIAGIVNASHPFASVLHRIVAEAAALAAVTVWRFERRYAARDRALPHLRYVPDFAAALATLATLGHEPLLALTGVQTIGKLRPWWERHQAYFQILDRPESFARAAAEGFPRGRLLAQPPAAEPEALVRTIAETGAKVMLTKESGFSGFQPVKEEAAARTGIPLLVVARPAVPASFIPVHSETELLAAVGPEVSA